MVHPLVPKWLQWKPSIRRTKRHIAEVISACMAGGALAQRNLLGCTESLGASAEVLFPSGNAGGNRCGHGVFVRFSGSGGFSLC